MTKKEIEEAFRRFGLENYEKREAILSQGKYPGSDNTQKINIRTWVSNRSDETEVKECPVGKKY